MSTIEKQQWSTQEDVEAWDTAILKRKLLEAKIAMLEEAFAREAAVAKIPNWTTAKLQTTADPKPTPMDGLVEYTPTAKPIPGCTCPACLADAPTINPNAKLSTSREHVELPAAEVLIRALEETYDFILDPDSRKCTRNMAMTKFGNPTDPCADDADKWCAVGYLAKALGEPNAAGICDAISLVYGAPTAMIWQYFDAGDFRMAAMCVENAILAIRKMPVPYAYSL